MDPVFLARFQFAFTIAFHWLFPSLTVGLSWYLVYFMIKYAKSGSDEDSASVRFWLKLFTISFAIGVVSGLVMAVEFGTNWANFSFLVGEVVGIPLVIEVLIAFFLESTFLGILLYGWGKVSNRLLVFSSIMVALGTTLSAFWILVVNSWMQTPAGVVFTYNSSGALVSAKLVDLWAAIFNPSMVIRFLHTFNATILVASFFILGTSAYYRLRDRYNYLTEFSYRSSLVVIFFASIIQLIIGHLEAGIVAETQPSKYATFELVFKTNSHQQFPLFALINPFNGDVLFRINLPFFTLSQYMLEGNKIYPGLDQFSASQLPPFAITVYSFHLMIAIGLGLIAFGALGIFLYIFTKLEINKFLSFHNYKFFYNKLYYYLCVLLIPLPFLATELGWFAAEIGRQPWIVYGVLPTSQGISANVPVWQLIVSIIVFATIYLIMFILWILLMHKTVMKGPQIMPKGTNPIQTGNISDSTNVNSSGAHGEND